MSSHQTLAMGTTWEILLQVVIRYPTVCVWGGGVCLICLVSIDNISLHSHLVIRVQYFGGQDIKASYPTKIHLTLHAFSKVTQSSRMF